MCNCVTVIKIVCFTWTLDEGPLIPMILWADGGVEQHVEAVLREVLHRSPVRALHTLPLARVAGVSTPSTVSLLQTLRTRPKARTVLS